MREINTMMQLNESNIFNITDMNELTSQSQRNKEVISSFPSFNEYLKKRADEKIKAEEAVTEKKHASKLKLRERMKKAAALRKRPLEETDTLPEPPARIYKKIRETDMPPAAGDGPTPMISAERATTMPPATVVNTPGPISRTEAENLARENEHITIVESRTYPGRYYMFNNQTNERRWIV